MELPCSGTLSYFTKFQFTLPRRALWEAHAGSAPEQFNEAYWRQLVLDPSLRVESVVSAAIDIPAEEEEVSFVSSQAGVGGEETSGEVSPSLQDLQSRLLPQLGSFRVPKTDRTNLKLGKAEESPQSLLLGLHTKRGMGITTQTTTQKGRELLQTIQEMAKLRPTPQPFLAVQVNVLKEGKMVDTHLNAFNHTACPTWTISMGEFQGGNLWVENYGEDQLPVELQDSERTPKGKVHAGGTVEFL
eukprot:5030220-Amphidinium_carterae.1